MPNGNYPGYNHDPLSNGAASIRLESAEIGTDTGKKQKKKTKKPSR